ncbi:MAG: hypothetical protein AB1491_07990 [Thermodesulfobacteriota bacterium]
MGNKWRTGSIILTLTLTLSLISPLSGLAFRTPFGDFVLQGDYRETRKLEREAAASRYNYCPTGGCVVRLESVQLNPTKAYKGGTLTLTTTYTILTPDDVAIPLSISREMFFRGESLGRVKDISTRNKNGTWVQEINITLPANAEPGVYTLNTRVSTTYGSDQKSLQFTVQ